MRLSGDRVGALRVKSYDEMNHYERKRFEDRYKENTCVYSLMLFISRSFTLVGKCFTPLEPGTTKIDKFCNQYARKYEQTTREEEKG